MPPAPVKSATRVLDVLELLAQQPQPLPHGEIAQALGMPKSSLTELLTVLEARGYIGMDADRYRLGPALLSLAGTLLRRTDVVRVAQPIIAALMLRTSESAALVLRQGTEVVVVCKENCDQAILVSAQLGERSPINNSAGGKAIMAFLPKPEQEAWLASGKLRRMTPHSVTDPEAMRRELAAIARGGISYSRESMFPGIVAMGLPVFDAIGNPCAGVSVAVPTLRFDKARETRVAAALRTAAADISAALGFKKNGRRSAA
jgi:DNA-binding IclR family transcriptional regulator